MSKSSKVQRTNWTLINLSAFLYILAQKLQHKMFTILSFGEPQDYIAWNAKERRPTEENPTHVEI